MSVRRIVGFLAIPLLLVLLAAMGNAAGIARQMPQEAHPGDQVNISLAINATVGERVLVAELLPQGAQLQNWSLQDLQAYRPMIRDGQNLIWELNVTGEDPALSYTVALNESAGFDAVFASSNGTSDNARASIILIPRSMPPAPAPLLAMPEPESSLSESPAPLGDAGRWPLLLALIIATCIGLVFVIETSSRHHMRRPFGHHSKHFVQHLMYHVVAQVRAMLHSTQGTLLYARNRVVRKRPHDVPQAAAAPTLPSQAPAPEPPVHAPSHAGAARLAMHTVSEPQAGPAAAGSHPVWSSPLFH